MVQVKNITTHDVSIITDSIRDARMKVQHIIKPGQTVNVPLCHGLKRLVEEGYISLIKGGEILDIPGGLVHRKAGPLPPLRSVDDEWSA